MVSLIRCYRDSESEQKLSQLFCRNLMGVFHAVRIFSFPLKPVFEQKRKHKSNNEERFITIKYVFKIYLKSI